MSGRIFKDIFSTGDRTEMATRWVITDSLYDLLPDPIPLSTSNISTVHFLKMPNLISTSQLTSVIFVKQDLSVKTTQVTPVLFIKPLTGLTQIGSVVFVKDNQA